MFHHAVKAYHLFPHVWLLGYNMLQARHRRELAHVAFGLGGHPVRPTQIHRRLAGNQLRLYVRYDGIRHHCNACIDASTLAV